MSPSRFGYEAAGDPKLVAELRRGRVVGPRMKAKLHAYLDEAERTPGEMPCRGRRLRRR